MFRPLLDRVLVKTADPESISKGGIIIAETIQGKPQEGTVVSTGPGIYEGGVFKEISVKAGDRVLFNKLAGSEVKVDGDTFLLIEDKQILGVLA
jgi:chaperonin GroES